MYVVLITAYNIVANYNHAYTIYKTSEKFGKKTYNLLQRKPVIYKINEELWEVIDYKSECISEYEIL